MPRVARLRAAPRRAPEPVPRFHPGPPLARPPRRRAIEGEPLLRRRRARLATAARAADGARVAPRGGARVRDRRGTPTSRTSPARTICSGTGPTRSSTKLHCERLRARALAQREENGTAHAACVGAGVDLTHEGVAWGRHRSQPELPRRVAERKVEAAAGAEASSEASSEASRPPRRLRRPRLPRLPLTRRPSPPWRRTTSSLLPRAVDVRHPAPRRVQPRVGRDARDRLRFVPPREEHDPAIPARPPLRPSPRSPPPRPSRDASSFARTPPSPSATRRASPTANTRTTSCCSASGSARATPRTRRCPSPGARTSSSGSCRARAARGT